MLRATSRHCVSSSSSSSSSYESFITKMRRYTVAASSHSGANTPANQRRVRMRTNPAAYSNTKIRNSLSTCISVLLRSQTVVGIQNLTFASYTSSSSTRTFKGAYKAIDWTELNWTETCLQSFHFSCVTRTVPSERTGSSVHFSRLKVGHITNYWFAYINT